LLHKKTLVTHCKFNFDITFLFVTVTVEISLFASKEKYAENEEVVNVTIRLDSELPDGLDEVPINYTTADGTASKL